MEPYDAGNLCGLQGWRNRPCSAATQALAARRRHTSRAASVVEPLLRYGSAGLWPAQEPSLPWGIATAAAPAPSLAAVLRLLLLLLRSAEDSEGGGCGMGRDADEAEGSHSYRREILCYISQVTSAGRVSSLQGLKGTQARRGRSSGYQFSSCSHMAQELATCRLPFMLLPLMLVPPCRGLAAKPGWSSAALASWGASQPRSLRIMGCAPAKESMAAVED